MQIIGSSLLIMYDAEECSAWMIDFAKTIPVDSNLTLNHRDTWKIGNHEDGYLSGLDSLIQVSCLHWLHCSFIFKFDHGVIYKGKRIHSQKQKKKVFKKKKKWLSKRFTHTKVDFSLRKKQIYQTENWKYKKIYTKRIIDTPEKINDLKKLFWRLLPLTSSIIWSSDYWWIKAFCCLWQSSSDCLKVHFKQHLGIHTFSFFIIEIKLKIELSNVCVCQFACLSGSLSVSRLVGISLDHI